MRLINFLGFLGLAFFIGTGLCQWFNAPPDGPWTELFNGENLDNWGHLGDPPWKVEDGLIKEEGGSNKNYLIWPEPLTNYEIKLKYRLSTGGANSGIQVRSFCRDKDQDLPDCGGDYVVCGPQLDVARAYSGRLFNECTGFLMFDGQNIDDCRSTLEVGEWMETTARMNEDSISLWFNGEHCLDYIFEDIDHLEGKIFAVQSHPPYDLIEWEYIKMRDLEAPVRGCMNPNSSNYNQQATVDDSSCLACTNKQASNYDNFCDTNICVDDGSCAVGIRLGRQSNNSRFRISGGAEVTYSINDRGPYRLRLLDPAGNLVLESSAEGPVQNAAFNLPFKGIFIVQIQTATSRYLKKLINL